MANRCVRLFRRNVKVQAHSIEWKHESYILFESNTNKIYGPNAFGQQSGHKAGGLCLHVLKST